MARILVACEESQAVTIELRKLGHQAYSCDIQDCSGGHPEWHIKGDVIKQLNKDWDMLIGFPTCTYLCNSGVSHLWKDITRWDKLIDASIFFKKLLEADIPLIAIENPIPHKYAVKLIGRKYDQLVQPYMFGHAESKATCFWLKGLPKLEDTNNVKEIWKQLPKAQGQKIFYCSPGKERAKIRSKTFPGLAKAIATQWSKLL